MYGVSIYCCCLYHVYALGFPENKGLEKGVENIFPFATQYPHFD